jgi:hypothetical protein
MCLILQRCIYQRVRTFNFLKKSQNRCSLMLIYDFFIHFKIYILCCLNFRIAYAFINFVFCLMFHDCKIRSRTGERGFLHFNVTVTHI